MGWFFLFFSLFSQANDCLPSIERMETGSNYEVYVSGLDQLKEDPYIGGLPYMDLFNLWLNKNISDTNPISLIQRQSRLYKDLGIEYSPLSDRLIKGEIGKIAKISCLNAYFLEKHMMKEGTHKLKTEMALIQIRHPLKSKIYWFFISSDSAGVKMPAPLLAVMEELLKEGAIFYSHLHSHLFYLEYTEGDIAGTLIPSQPDLDVYQALYNKYGLKYAQITNGLHSIDIHLKEIF